MPFQRGWNSAWDVRLPGRSKRGEERDGPGGMSRCQAVAHCCRRSCRGQRTTPRTACVDGQPTGRQGGGRRGSRDFLRLLAPIPYRRRHYREQKLLLGPSCERLKG